MASANHNTSSKKQSRALLVSWIIWSAIIPEAVAHARDRQTFWYRKRAHAKRHQSQLRQAIDAAETACRNGHDADGLSLILRQQIIERVLKHAGIAVVVFGSDDDKCVRARDFVRVFLQTRRRILAMMQSLFHDGKVVFE